MKNPNMARFGNKNALGKHWHLTPEQREVHRKLMLGKQYCLGKHWKWTEERRLRMLGRKYPEQSRLMMGNQRARGKHWKMSTKGRENISRARIGNKNCLGHKHTKEWKEAASKRIIANHGYGHGNYGANKGKHWKHKSNEKYKNMNKDSKNPSYIDGRSKNRKHNPNYYGEDWLKARQESLDFADNKCFLLESDNCKGKIGVHHIDDYTTSRDNSQNNLLVLCDRHHKKFEWRWRKK